MAPTQKQKPRVEILKVLSEYEGASAEIGVQDGIFSTRILDETKTKKLYMIDAWREFAIYRDVANVSDNFQAMKLLTAVQNTNGMKERRCVINELSEEAAKIFPDLFFDWIYIDANHSYEGVLSDLKAWWPKVRSGGILCGDDYCDGENDDALFGVEQAVKEFFSGLEFKKPVHLIETKDEMTQWWVRK